MVIQTKKQDKLVAEGFEINTKKISYKNRKRFPLGNKFRELLYFEMVISPHSTITICGFGSSEKKIKTGISKLKNTY